MNWITTHLLNWLVAAVPIGAISFAVAQYVKKGSNWVDAQGALFKRFILLPLIAAAVTALGAALHVNIVCDATTNCLTHLDSATIDAAVKAALGVVVAWIAHAGKQGNTSTPPTPPTP